MLIGVGGFAFGLYSFYNRQIAILQNLEFDVANVQIKDTDWTGTKLLITLNVINRSEIDFTLTGYDLVIMVNGEQVSKVSNKNLNEKVKDLGQLSKINFYATINPEQLFTTDIIENVLGNFGETDIRISGKVGIRKWGINLPEYTLDLPFKLKDFI